jgi:hypothetical protein
MNQALSYVVGAGVCCVVPMVMFFAGVYYAKYGLPFSVQWRGMQHSGEEEDV